MLISMLITAFYDIRMLEERCFVSTIEKRPAARRSPKNSARGGSAGPIGRNATKPSVVERKWRKLRLVATNHLSRLRNICTDGRTAGRRRTARRPDVVARRAESGDERGLGPPLTGKPKAREAVKKSGRFRQRMLTLVTPSFWFPAFGFTLPKKSRFSYKKEEL